MTRRSGFRIVAGRCVILLALLQIQRASEHIWRRVSGDTQPNVYRETWLTASATAEGIIP